jgi:hypothetical protein
LKFFIQHKRSTHSAQNAANVHEQRAALNDQREEKQYKVHGVLCAFWRAIGDVRSAV